MIGADLIVEDTFQEAWIETAQLLRNNGWEAQNLMVSIENPVAFDKGFNQSFNTFANDNSILRPKDVAYTIFPHKLYGNRYGSAKRLFKAYNRPDGLFDRLQKRRHSSDWGTYFKRMTEYPASGGKVNQLANIISAIKRRRVICKASYTVVIQKPGGETIRPRGGPCLNYLTIQLDSRERSLGILAVYRNHDFLEKAYGNYWGLCNLLIFLARETGFCAGSLTCISSHAYVDRKRSAFKEFMDTTI